MSKNDDYQLEELEDSAVKKSKIAKRVAVSAALLGSGAATAVAAEQLSHESAENANSDALTEDDVKNGAQMGAVDNEVLDGQGQSNPVNTPSQTQEVHVYHHYDNPPVVEPDVVPDSEITPEPTVEPEPEVEFESTTLVYDEDGNMVSQVDEGTIDGSKFAVMDVDGDGKADYLLYDENNDGNYQENEVQALDDSFKYTMGHGSKTYYVQTDSDGKEEPYDPSGEDHEDELADITNDFTDEKAGDEYQEDLAENTSDYQNNGDVDQYAAEYGSTVEDTSAYDIV